MPARVKKVTSVVLMVILAYVGYTLLQISFGTSRQGRGDLQHDAFVSHLRMSGSNPLTNQELNVVVTAKEAQIDVRSDYCRQKRYVNVEQLTASLVVDLPDTGVDVDQFHSNINSLLSGAQSLLDEIIIVAAGLQPSAATQLEHYLTSLGVECRIIRNSAAGQVASRVAGAKSAKSPVVVFADWRVVGTFGWLRPLLGALTVETSSIIMPHLNDVSDPSKFATTPERLLPEYNWPLGVRMTDNSSAVLTSRGLYRSSALRGDLFAVRLDFWNQLGGYDEDLSDDSAAANLDLSIRLWQCGSGDGTRSIFVHRCSHIGVRNLGKVVRVVQPLSVKQITQQWFGKRRTIMMRSVGIPVDPSGLTPRPVGRLNVCRSIDTYFNDVASAVPVPSTEAIRFGQLQAYTDVCARAHDDGRIDLTGCWPTSSYSLSSQIFELKANGRLMTYSGQCLTVQRNSYVLLDACRSSMNGQQSWRYDELTERLMNPWSDFCAMHVTDPDKIKTKRWRQILMAQNCTVDINNGQIHDSSIQKFMRWKFINP